MNQNANSPLPRRSSKTTIYILIGAIVVVLIALIAVVSAIGGGGSFEAKGMIVDEDDDWDCALSGDQVVIMDSSGNDLAVGNLDSPEGNLTDGSYTCVYSFTIPEVEGGHDIYKMTIGNTEAPRQTQDELESGVLLTFG